ncbi:hypothetical protein L1049_024266 [Liquidambar formosana]|uniref:RNase H type-1 domain-containing protein n=1 Tax=Liquidambar formosana TaxID=63359 RepID=A0AAP0RUN5_LIQFO
MSHFDQNQPPVSYPPPATTYPSATYAAPPPAGYPVKDDHGYPQNAPLSVETKSRGDGFWKGWKREPNEVFLKAAADEGEYEQALTQGNTTGETANADRDIDQRPPKRQPPPALLFELNFDGAWIESDGIGGAEMGIKGLLVEGDAKGVIECMTRRKEMVEEIAIICGDTQLLANKAKVEVFCYTSRKHNCADDAMAKHALRVDDFEVWLEDPPV